MIDAPTKSDEERLVTNTESFAIRRRHLRVEAHFVRASSRIWLFAKPLVVCSCSKAGLLEVVKWPSDWSGSDAAEKWLKRSCAGGFVRILLA